MRKSITAAALSLLVLSSATAFASEGTFEPQQVASPASGAAPRGDVGMSFVYSMGEGGQTASAPAAAAARPASPTAVAAGAFAYNPGLNG